MLVLGDAHADDPGNRQKLLAAYDEADPDVAIQVGDLLYYDPEDPTWFIAGNNEDFDVIETLRRGDPPLDGRRRLHLLASDTVEVCGLSVGGLSGNFAPNWYDRDRSDLEGDRRRHFVRDDVERALSLRDVDVFLVHEAPHGLLRIAGRDVGCDPVDELLSRLSPDLCLVGHYHRHAETTIEGTRVVSLAPVWQGYYTLDPETLSLERTPVTGDP